MTSCSEVTFFYIPFSGLEFFEHWLSRTHFLFNVTPGEPKSNSAQNIFNLLAPFRWKLFLQFVWCDIVSMSIGDFRSNSHLLIGLSRRSWLIHNSLCKNVFPSLTKLFAILFRDLLWYFFDYQEKHKVDQATAIFQLI